MIGLTKHLVKLLIRVQDGVKVVKDDSRSKREWRTNLGQCL